MPSRVSQLVNYRSPRDSRWTWNWTLEGFYANRQDAERAARRGEIVVTSQLINRSK